jgi:hypothetical protein
MNRYVYSVIRFVPDPARGEFVNVGAVVGSEDTGEWDVRQVSSLKRAKAIDERGSLPAVTSIMEDLTGTIALFTDAIETGESVLDVYEPTEEWLTSLHGLYHHVVQMTRPAPITSSSIEDAMAMVFNEVVIGSESSRRAFTPRTVASKGLRNAYLATNKLRRNHQFFERVQLETGRQSETLDFAVVNGEVLQLAQAWSFSIPEQAEVARRVRAWGWTMRHMRETGGVVRLDGRQYDVKPDVEVDLEVVYVPPVADYGNAAFDDASEVFVEIGARATPLNDAAEVAERAVSLLAESA